MNKLNISYGWQIIFDTLFSNLVKIQKIITSKISGFLVLVILKITNSFVEIIPPSNIPVSQTSIQSTPVLIQLRCKGTDFISLDITTSSTKAHKSEKELNFMMAVDYAISTFCHTWSIIPRLVQTWTIEKLIPQLDIPSFSIFTLAPSLSSRRLSTWWELRTFFRCFSIHPFNR